jgi:hypothetical protein
MIVILHTAYNKCSKQSLVTMKMKVIAIATNLALVLTLVLTTLYAQFAFGRLVLTPDFGGIRSVNNTGYIVCNPNCNPSSNSHSGDSAVEAAYRLTVNVPSHPIGTSKVGIFITTTNGYTDQADVPTAGGLHIFNIPKNQGYSVQVCVNSGTFSHDNCRTYETTGNDMSVSLPAASPTSSDESN